MTTRQVRRAFELVRAKKFADYIANPAPKDCNPGGWITVPQNVRIEDVVMWHNREAQAA